MEKWPDDLSDIGYELVGHTSSTAFYKHKSENMTLITTKWHHEDPLEWLNKPRNKQ